MQTVRNKINELVGKVKPFDELEEEHINDVLSWIDSGVEIFRIEKPATPPKHLVSYAVLVDLKQRKILLLDHRKALKKLPSGGHIDVNEMPFEAAKRELLEELEIEPKLIFESETPLFITVTETVGLTAGHIDVSLWYAFAGNSTETIKIDTEEFKKEFGGYHWLSFEEILSKPIDELDAHMHRFVNKLKTFLADKIKNI